MSLDYVKFEYVIQKLLIYSAWKFILTTFMESWKKVLLEINYVHGIE